MSDDINYITIDEFQAEGYLHELNRQFLHPLGLALEVRQGWTRKDVEKALDEAGIQFGSDAVDSCMTMIRVLGLDKRHLGGVWDYRDDPEGMVYGEDLLNAEKADRIATRWDERMAARVDLLGYMVQPVDKPYEENDA